MCGIFGLINKTGKAVQDLEILSGIQLLDHRGPDAQGIFLENSFGLGNCRLSIFDLGPRSNQPMNYLHYHISYNGALYNYLEIKQELKSMGYHFKTKSDTEVILAAYDCWGQSCVKHFNGMWAFAIYDQKKKFLFCSRDRFGIKPFYYWQDNSYFSFASEIKAFQAVSGWSAKLNVQRASEYLLFGMQDQDALCLFEGVHQLPAAHNLGYNIDSNQVSISSYYEPGSSFKFDASGLSVIDQFKELFSSSINLRLRSDVLLGSCLSGGLDSSSIVACILSQNTDYHLSTISAQYNFPEISERKYVNDIKQKWSFQNNFISPGFDDMVSVIDQVIYQQDEPFSSFSVLAQYHVFKKAKELGLKVMLGGQGADELLGGYDIFWGPYLKSVLHQSPWSLPLVSFQSIRQNDLSLLKLFHGWRRIKAKEYPAKKSWLRLDYDMGKFQKRSLSKTIRDQSIQLITGMGLPVLLHYEDRNSMAHGVESRLPFLDYRLVDFCLSMDDKWKIHAGQRKYILREAMKKKLPASIYKRKDKKGFETPQSRWFKKNRKFIDAELKTALRELDFISEGLPMNHDIHLRVMLFHRWVKKFGVSF